MSIPLVELLQTSDEVDGHYRIVMNSVSRWVAVGRHDPVP